MRTRTLVLTAVVGVGLAGATLFQATAIGTGGVMARAGSGTASAPGTASATTPRVAAEGRVVAYPGAEVKVAAERGGRLLRVTVEEGQKVRRGEVLVEIESEELRAALDEARARLVEAEAEIKLAELNRTGREQLVKQQVVAV